MSAPALAATITLRFESTEALSDALRTYSGQFGMGGLCLQVTKYYELGDLVLLHIEHGAGEPLTCQATVAWRRAGYIGARFQPATADQNRAFMKLRRLMGEAAEPAPAEAPARSPTPFAE